MSLAGAVGDRAEADLGLEFLGADVLGQRQRAGIDQHLVAMRIVADHRGQHRQREIARAARADERLVEIVEAIDARPHLGDAGEVARMHRRRRRAARHDRAGDAGGADLFRRRDDRQPLLLGDRRDPVGGALMIGVAGVGHHTRKLDARRVVQDAGNVEQAGQLRIGQAGAAGAAVDLDEDREGVAVPSLHRRSPRQPDRLSVTMRRLTPLSAQLGHGRQAWRARCRRRRKCP